VSVGEYLRRAAKGYSVSTDNQILEAMIDQMNQATKCAEDAIDETLNFVAESSRRNAPSYRSRRPVAVFAQS
jgi:hypothetical protein